MAITINKCDENELKEEFPKHINPETTLPFANVKHFVEHIVNNWRKVLQNPEQSNQLPQNHEEILILKRQLEHATAKAVKAGVNRQSLLKELSQIQ